MNARKRSAQDMISFGNEVAKTKGGYILRITGVAANR